MQLLIEKITNKSKLNIFGQIFNVKAKARYIAVQNPENEYYKIFLNSHNVLVLSPIDNFVYFGTDVENIGLESPFEKEIEYNNKKYELINEDYQILVKLEFGSPLETEGEVEFWDYQCEDNQDELISIGIVKRTNKRADIVAKIISIEEIKIINS